MNLMNDLTTVDGSGAGTPPSAADLITAAYGRYGPHVALVSSFGAEAAVMLHLVSQVSRHIPVIVLDTLLLFPETLAYQRSLSAHLGLSDVRLIRPDEGADPDRTLHQSDSQACCHLRKVAPLAKALEGFEAVLTGRKQFQTDARKDLGPMDQDAQGRVRINPLYDWSAEQTQAYLSDHDLPLHPLVAHGYASIGCMPCTTPVKAGEDARAGRWRGEARQECGIHYCNGKLQRGLQRGPETRCSA